ncbi:8-amino-7-oxononanoate synthase [Campylobacter iguaniorum]|uniref:8-amino-7-oxononanoate synthase n=1 Tax=Campylobacter iguaniorum TaxID=1244531 RepID=A0A076F8N5_9BACT|nr:aminotransferase class I/II-fold pyridoxal phosphate-dependent enzyme [Campylobacter iguaniorum]AII14361.1 8-amino-7-oxononanoate synthase [Campylobacter iguaniorum]
MFDIQKAKENSNFRELKHSKTSSKFIEFNDKKLLNLGSNDYLGIATNKDLRDEFLDICKQNDWFFGSGASRLVYTSNYEFDALEAWFEEKLDKKATIFNSGYCANLSCISTLSDENTLFLCDKLIHASMIDALKLANANFKRYAHNDLETLANLLSQNANKFEKIVILSESVFSMDGDNCDLQGLVNLKKKYTNVLLYIDEAHSFFVRHELGFCHALGLSKEVDFTLVTLGKGIGSEGAVMLCSAMFRDIFINSARSLIYSTSLPSINVAWSHFILNKNFSQERQNLEKNIKFLGLNNSHICAFLVGSSGAALSLSQKLFDNGYFAPAIRPPTVPNGTSRLRISLRGDILERDLVKLKEILDENRVC